LSYVKLTVQQRQVPSEKESTHDDFVFTPAELTREEFVWLAVAKFDICCAACSHPAPAIAKYVGLTACINQQLYSPLTYPLTL
jgi:hypothetical protein